MSIMQRTHGRLWSLWNMLLFDQNSFIYLAKEMKRLGTVLEKVADNEFRTQDQKDNDAKIISGYRAAFLSGGFPMCVAQIDRIVNACDPEIPLKARDLAYMVTELSNRMEDECKILGFFTLSQKEMGFFGLAGPLFGQEFNDQFPTNGAFEVDEAGKCLGLSDRAPWRGVGLVTSSRSPARLAGFIRLPRRAA